MDNPKEIPSPPEKPTIMPPPEPPFPVKPEPGPEIRPVQEPFPSTPPREIPPSLPNQSAVETKHAGMKTKSLIIVTLVAISLMACHPTQLMRTMLRDQAKRGEMYHEILKNETYRAQLMDSIRNNRHTKLLLNSQNQFKKSAEDSKSGNR